MSRLELTAISSYYGEEIKSGCALSLTYQEVIFDYKGRCHTLKYKQTKKGNYFILNGIRYYFKIYDNAYNKWLIDCNCF